MSLRINVDRVADHEKVCFDDGQMKPVTEMIGKLSMAGGYSRITEQNVAEVHRRVGILGELLGAPLIEPDGAERFITLEEMRAHIGLSTNSTVFSKAVFNRKVVEELEMRARRRR